MLGHEETILVLRTIIRSLILLAGVGVTSRASDSQLSVFVYNDAHIPVRTLESAEVRVSDILGKAGLNIAYQNSLGLPASVRITENQPANMSPSILGVTYLGADGTGRYVDIFYPRIARLSAGSHTDLATLLGTVIAHELGHLLLGSNSHAAAGIMQLHWGPDELRKLQRGTLLFLPEEQSKMRARLLPKENEGRRQLAMAR